MYLIKKNDVKETTFQNYVRTLKIKTVLRDAYFRGYLINNFAGLVKTRGK